MRRFAVGTVVMCIAAVTIASVAGSAPVAPVPSDYRAVYAELEGQLRLFDNAVQSRWDGSKAPVVFSAELLAANGHLGLQLLRPGHFEATLLSVDRLRALGVRAVTVQVSFPMLYRPFFRTDEEYVQYLDFYRRLADAIRARGLHLIVKTQALFSKGSWTDMDVAAFYRQLTLDQYVRGRTEVARTLARELRPDYLSVVMEPDTEADQTGLPMNTPANSVRVVTQVLGALKSAGITGIRVGAGAGTWHPQYEAFTRAFASTGVDYVDLHVYPVNRDYLDRAVTMARLARQSGKGTAMTEAWLYKAGSADLTRGFTAESIFGRDAFSFWEPLDRRFLEVMVKFAHAERLLFLSPFWTKYFHAYVDYDAARSLGPAQLVALSAREAGKAIVENRFTQTGLTYQSLITRKP